MNLRNLAQQWCPPVLWRWASKARKSDRIRFEGNYLSWADARRESTGYNTEAVFHRVRDAALKVKRGEAVFERDSVCFYLEDYRWPILACLLSVANKREGRLNVLDFGGSLGSFYFQHKKFLSRLDQIDWAVVEQERLVECGRDEIQDRLLKFYTSVGDCLAHGPIDVILISAVLQYLEFPYEMFGTLAQSKAPYILIDRTPFIETAQDRLAVQYVPDSIYHASYPAWFLSRPRFDRAIQEAGYRLITDCPCDDEFGIGKFQGLFLERA